MIYFIEFCSLLCFVEICFLTIRTQWFYMTGLSFFFKHQQRIIAAFLCFIPCIALSVIWYKLQIVLKTGWQQTFPARFSPECKWLQNLLWTLSGDFPPTSHYDTLEKQCLNIVENILEDLLQWSNCILFYLVLWMHSVLAGTNCYHFNISSPSCCFV